MFRSLLAAGRPRRAAATLAVAALALTGLGTVSIAAAAAEPDLTFAADDLEPGSYTEDVTVGGVRIAATTAKDVTVDANAKTSSTGLEFGQRLKLNGAGEAAFRSVHLSTDGEATLTVFALSSSADADRSLELHAADGGLIDTLPAYGDPGPTIPAATAEIPGAGDYYLFSPSSGVNLYYLEVTAGAPAERGDWADVAEPVITGVDVDPNDPGTLLVDFDGVTGPDGADLATATLIDDGGEPADSASLATVGDSGTIALTPPASGVYTVQVSLTRTDEDTALSSEPYETGEFTLPLATPVITGALTTAVDPGGATLTVSWQEVPEAEEYTLAYRPAGDGEFLPAATGLTEASGDVPALTPGEDYEFTVTALRGTDETTSEPFAATASSEVERWQTAHAGVGSGGEIAVGDDGTIAFDARDNNGKIADSEDGFLYYYTQIDPAAENFTLTATFTVDDASAKDNQSGFGIIAVDALVPDDPSARYFNSAGAMAAKYTRTTGGTLESRYGVPGGKFVTGYTGPPTEASADRDMSASEPFDWDFKADYTEGANANPPKFTTGEEYTFTLGRSNTGFHASSTIDGEPHEVIYYDPDMLLAQDSEAFTVGVFTTRKIAVTVSDLEFTTIDPADDDEAQEPPTTYIDPELTIDVTRTTSADSLEVPLASNVRGEVSVLDEAGDVVGGAQAVTPGAPASVTVPLAAGANEFTARLVPSTDQDLGEFEELSSYDPLEVPLTITSKRYGEPGEAILVAPDGSAGGDGTAEHPLDIHTAVTFAQPGQQIVLTGGEYALERAVRIDRGNDGTAAAPIVLMSEPGTRARLDLSGSDGGGILLSGDYWHLYDLEITGSRGYRKPLLISGHHNRIERITSHHNGDTGVQISGSATEDPIMWPSHNLVISSVAHDNADPQANDADGFAAKLTVGEGNAFRYCISHHNIDDGWDLYAKSTTGPIGAVTVEDSVAYRNGALSDDVEFATIGEGNGFKLGGESMPGAHVLRNSVSYDNIAKGVTSNSGPDVRVHEVTAYHNGRAVPDAGRMNLQLTTNAAETDYEVTGLISYEGGQRDDVVLAGQSEELLDDPSNHFDGRDASDDWFVSLDMDLVPEIAADGSVEMHGLLEPTDAAPGDAGARLGPNPDPTVIELLPVVSGEGDDADSDSGGGDDSSSESADAGTTGVADAGPGSAGTVGDTGAGDQGDPAGSADRSDLDDLPDTGAPALPVLLLAAGLLFAGALLARSRSVTSTQRR